MPALDYMLKEENKMYLFQRHNEFPNSLTSSEGESFFLDLISDFTETNIKSLIEQQVPLNINIRADGSMLRELLRYGQVLDGINYITEESGSDLILNTLYRANDEFSIKNESKFHTDFNTGLCILRIGHKDYFDNTIYGVESDIKFLEAAQEEMKQEDNHFLRIFTLNNWLFAVTTKLLTEENLCKLYLLKLKLFEHLNKYKTNYATDYFNAFLNKDLDLLAEVLDNIQEDKKLKNIYYDSIIKVFSKPKEIKIHNYKDNISNYRQDIERRKNEIANLSQRISSLSLQLTALVNKEEQNDSEIIKKYIMKSPYIEKIEIIGDAKIALFYKAPLLYYDDYIIEKTLPHYYGFSQDVLKVFLNHEYELIARCCISFDLIDFSITTYENLGNSHDCIRHPHIDRYNCFGNHEDTLEEPAENNDYLGALEQITQGVLNLNFTDSCVIEEMLYNLENNSHHMICWKNKETGVMLSTNEVLGGKYG